MIQSLALLINVLKFCWYRTGDKVVLNTVPGHFFRGEPGVGDGSILVGKAGLSSPWLH